VQRTFHAQLRYDRSVQWLRETFQGQLEVTMILWAVQSPPSIFTQMKKRKMGNVGNVLELQQNKLNKETEKV